MISGFLSGEGIGKHLQQCLSLGVLLEPAQIMGIFLAGELAHGHHKSADELASEDRALSVEVKAG